MIQDIRGRIIYRFYHTFLDSFKSSKTRFDRYFSLKSLLRFLSGCTFMTAFLNIEFTCSGLSISARETCSHSGQMVCKVAMRVAVLLIILPFVYPHFYHRIICTFMFYQSSMLACLQFYLCFYSSSNCCLQVFRFYSMVVDVDLGGAFTVYLLKLMKSSFTFLF